MKKNGELSLEQLRRKLHISKRKAAWMLCDFDEKNRTIFKERVTDLDMEVKSLVPPFSAGDQYSLISC